ncbi:MAG: energy-coupling factor ABC transporter ATP-binding protein [Lachnospiraceae bacterium]|nr:energy-coupling factor ABC transporter ATP-binding protein [Lachnospiraceae bacterium]
MSLSATNISFKYFKDTNTNIIQHFNLSLEKGKITLLTGKSGCGKSTLAYILAGLYPENTGFLESGEVLFEGQNIHALTPNERVPYVTMMFQNPDLQFCMTNLNHELAFCLENIGVPEAKMPALIQNAVRCLDIEHLLGRSFYTMSGGEKQKCALCCIFVLRSQCIILDEAFANIDGESARDIIAMLQKMNVTVLAIDHNISLWDGAYDNIISMDGSDANKNAFSAHLHPAGEDILTAEHLSVRDIHYPKMSFQKGSISAILGKSGCGKTTFFHTLIGQNKYKGKLTLKGQTMKGLRKKTLFSQCGIVFQNPANQFLALNVFDEILVSVKRWHKEKDEDWQKEKTLALLDLFQLKKYLHYSPYLLSQGQQRRLAVLSMIAGEQEILLLDEPTYGQDFENISNMMKLLVEKAQHGLTIIFTTHNEHVAQAFAHQIIRL